MSEYRICKIKVGQHEIAKHINFDSKEDAEHYAKNESSNDDTYHYEVQKNEHGQFTTIKSYLNGEVV